MAKPKMMRAIEVDGKLYEKMRDGTLVPLQDKTDRARLRAMTDADIKKAIAEDPDAAPILDAEWFKRARLSMPPKGKTPVTLRLDNDLLKWLRSQDGYQTRINSMLRKWMEAERSGR